MQKRSMLSQLRINGISYLLSALLLLVGIPLYQLLVLNPTGYGTILAGNNGPALATAYLHWIGAHQLQFIIHRLLLTLTFVLLLTLPFVLFRIIVAQELVAQVEQGEVEEDEETEDGSPAHPWRGKGFVIIALWAGLSGLLLYILGTIGGTIYLVSASSATMPANFTLISSLFSLVPNSIGIGLLALSTLFFGAMIARRGRYIWPGIWVAFGYAALAVAALFSGSAVGVASSPATGQATLTTPAMLLFALWVLWFGIMLVRLQPE
ncbi:hypothetical protein KSF_022230 [Reticulibacter mediterranei]|uniref:Uncharacterized protein n=1 Tax=Reticulibacter mediterranei TaxID=2778369 RepID=A0A8J3IJZ3_9CHLR|nr:hypothetical protein [Reticulibacter mediterranei]GHO92175.1 hypothetical protein KSF_022230 [Reticulibacter mediterranei]